MSRSERRCTGFVGICPDGINPKPMIIVCRKTYDSEINFEYPADGFSIAYQPKSFMTKRLFKKFLIETIIPFFNQKRRLYNYDGYAVIIMDNLKAHENAVSELSNELASVPHASDQLQMLDVGIFSFPKTKIFTF